MKTSIEWKNVFVLILVRQTPPASLEECRKVAKNGFVSVGPNAPCKELLLLGGCRIH